MTISVNVLAMQHSRGLLLDSEVLRRVLGGLPVNVVESRIGRPKATILELASELASIGYHRIRKFDVNLHLEDIKPRWVDCARRNWWVPNQEWVRLPIESIRSRADLVLCKTRIGERIFAGQGLPTRFIGFTTADRNVASVPRERRALHVVGHSPNKGTAAVLAAWQRHPEWPPLDLVWKAPPGIETDLPSNILLHRSPVADEKLLMLQNRSAYHVCPSAVEGFGHTLVEAMSCGACIITTDAPPMHELVGPDRGILVPWDRMEPRGLGTAFHVTAEGLETSINLALALPSEVRGAMGDRARSWFLANDIAFRDRLRTVLAELST